MKDFSLKEAFLALQNDSRGQMQVVGAVGLATATGAVFYYVAELLLDELNVTGGLWTVALLIIPIVVVLGALKALGFF